ncbi:MAG: endonuclease [Candidatus Amulumruptor caecigallinarius]|nr:endonuclease [Candidatus Amulumruptor caecigallinarius]
MKKLSILASLLAAIVITASADYREGYYNAMDGKRKEELKAAAKQCVKNHTTLGYYDLPNYWRYSDVYPELVNGETRWWEMYSNAVYLIRNGQSGTQSFSANHMQREHAVPKSWWKKNGNVEYTPAYSDMWNLYPSDAAANQAKLNYAFGETRSTTFDNGVTKIGPPKQGLGGGSSEVFEPADEYKGDFARALFYMATVYDDINWVYNWMFVKDTYPTLVPWACNMLLQWSRMDPVSQKEIDRNNAVEQYQGNRNPFVDFPNLAEYIWGTRMQEQFLISEQENLDPTPPITGDPEITQPVSGEALDFGQTAVGHLKNRTLRIVGKNLTTPLSLRVVGADRNCFTPSVTSIPAATINTNGGYLLDVAYLPGSIGSHRATLTLYDGGIDGSIAVTLKGEALEMPQMYALHALEPVMISDTEYEARWEAPQGIADYYVVTRVRYREGNSEAESYETGETTYTFSDRDPNVAESYTVTYNRLGIESPTSNSVYVAASGINDIVSDTPYRVYATEGGVRVIRSSGEAGHLRIYNISGTAIVSDDDPADETLYLLPAGTYVVTIANGRPQKLIVR